MQSPDRPSPGPAVDHSSITWRGSLSDEELERLHAEAFDHPQGSTPWAARLERWSLGWVTARDGDALVGFINVTWDGGEHAVLFDTCVAREARGRGIGLALVEAAAEGARAAGCSWLHVDFEDHLAPFYLDGAGFRPTAAGVFPL